MEGFLELSMELHQGGFIVKHDTMRTVSQNKGNRSIGSKILVGARNPEERQVQSPAQKSMEWVEGIHVHIIMFPTEHFQARDVTHPKEWSPVTMQKNGSHQRPQVTAMHGHHEGHQLESNQSPTTDQVPPDIWPGSMSQLALNAI